MSKHEIPPISDRVLIEMILDQVEALNELLVKAQEIGFEVQFHEKPDKSGERMNICVHVMLDLTEQVHKQRNHKGEPITDDTTHTACNHSSPINARLVGL